MLFQHEAEAPLQTALVDRVDNAQSHACRTSPDGQEVRQGSGPCPVAGTPGRFPVSILETICYQE